MRCWYTIVVVFFLAAIVARGHESRPAYLELRETSADAYEMLWKVPAKGTVKRLRLDVRLPKDCEATKPLSSLFRGGAHIERSAFSRSGGLDGQEIYIEGLASTLTDALVRVERMDGSFQTVRLTPSAPSFVVDATSTAMDVARTYAVLGIEHIWAGVDHLLFVACLIFIAGTWKRILVTVTGFTIAHSITLALAALNLMRLPVPPVEATIALSIVFLAMEISKKRRDSLTWRYPIFVSSAFGLLHGFGFASALGIIGLPQTEIPTALLCFNVGVEVGQILFVLALIIATRLVVTVAPKLKEPELVALVTRAAVYAIGTSASYWMFERIVGFTA